MDFRPTIKNDLKSVIDWIPDAKSCKTWAGPNVSFPLELEQLCKDIDLDNVQTYSLIETNKLLALGQLRIFESNRGHLARIVVNPAERGKGIGRIFCEKLIAQARKLNCRTISLHVVKDNSKAIGLYKKLGFIIPDDQPDAIRKDIYYMELV